MVSKGAGSRERVIECRTRVKGPLSAEASSKVTVWAVVSLFVHVTLLPLGTVRLAGSKARFLISTAVEPLVGAAGVTKPPGLGRLRGGTELAEPEQAAMVITVRTMNVAVVSARDPGRSIPSSVPRTWLWLSTVGDHHGQPGPSCGDDSPASGAIECPLALKPRIECPGPRWTGALVRRLDPQVSQWRSRPA